MLRKATMQDVPRIAEIKANTTSDYGSTNKAELEVYIAFTCTEGRMSRG